MNFEEAMKLCEKGIKVRAKNWLNGYYLEFDTGNKDFYLVSQSGNHLFKFKVDYLYEEFEFYKVKTKKYLSLEEILPNFYKGNKLYSDNIQKDMYLHYSAGTVALVGNTGKDFNYVSPLGALFNGSWYILIDEEEL